MRTIGIKVVAKLKYIQADKKHFARFMIKLMLFDQVIVLLRQYNAQVSEQLSI